MAKMNLLTASDVAELKSLIENCYKLGKSLHYISDNHPKYKYKTVQYYNTKFFSETVKIKNPVLGDKIKKILESSRDNGLTLIQTQKKHPEYKHGIFQYYNRIFKILEIKNAKLYSDEKINDILTIAMEFGAASTAKKYNINPTQIYEWAKRQNICLAFRKTREYQKDEIIKILTKIEQYNIDTNTKSGVKIIGAELNICHTNIYEWNKRHKIINTKKHSPKTLLCESEIDLIIKKSFEFKNVRDLSIAIGRTQITVKKILELNDIKCDRFGIHHKKR